MRCDIKGFLEIVQATPAELTTLCLEYPSETDLGCYARILQAYLRADVDELARLSNGAQGIVAHLAELRLSIRRPNQSGPPSLGHAPSPWSAELVFVEAMAFEIAGDESRAHAAYLEAQRQFHKLGGARKAAKAYHNALACLGRLDPTKRQIPQFFEAARLAREAGDPTTAGAALNNLSREFQLMKAHQVALRTSNEALKLLREHAYGSYPFYLALCHRTHLYIELGDLARARVDFEEASVSSMPEVVSAVEVLRGWLEPQTTGATPDHALPTWSERQGCGLSDGVSLSSLEAQLVELVAAGPRDRVTLIEELYRGQGDFFALENRFKQLVHRLRKKMPGLLAHEDGSYFLLESPTAEGPLRVAR